VAGKKLGYVRAVMGRGKGEWGGYRRTQILSSLLHNAKIPKKKITSRRGARLGGGLKWDIHGMADYDAGNARSTTADSS